MGRDPYAAPWGNDDEHVHDPNDYADAHVELGPPRCPYCGRVMSNRESAEQGACNDCYG